MQWNISFANVPNVARALLSYYMQGYNFIESSWFTYEKHFFLIRITNLYNKYFGWAPDSFNHICLFEARKEHF